MATNHMRTPKNETESQRRERGWRQASVERDLREYFARNFGASGKDAAAATGAHLPLAEYMAAL